MNLTLNPEFLLVGVRGGASDVDRGHVPPLQSFTDTLVETYEIRVALLQDLVPLHNCIIIVLYRERRGY